MTNPKIPHFTDSIFYSIEQISRYLDIHGKDFFSAIDDTLTPEEYSTIDVILCHEDICQRDLAKLILKDRVRTKRILDSLYNKGIIKFYSDIKNNRLVKKMEITPFGQKKFDEVTEKIQPYLNEMCVRFTETQVSDLKKLLSLLQDALASTANLQI